MGSIVIACYKPRPGCADALLDLVRGHVPILRELGLVTEREPAIARTADGTLVEVFEWKSQDAIAGAHDDPAVQDLWKRFEKTCWYETPSNLPEFQNMFSHFEPLAPTSSTCGTESSTVDEPDIAPSGLEAWLRAHDRLWLDGRLEEFANDFRADVVFVAPGSGSHTTGLAAALQGYRMFLETSCVEAFETQDYRFTYGPGTVIAEYAWTMRWTSESVQNLDRGRDILALDLSGGRIAIFWRTQLPVEAPAT